VIDLVTLDALRAVDAHGSVVAACSSPGTAATWWSRARGCSTGWRNSRRACTGRPARAGLGIALSPRLGRAPLGPDLAAVPVADPVPSRAITAVHRVSTSDSPALAVLLAALVAVRP
jgi:DNA-binding transcriptional LysR family regulator